MGKLIDGFYDDRIGHLLVGTEENVIAALSVDNGDIIWRRVLETGDRGSIQYLQSLNEDANSANSLRVSGRQEQDRFMITVTGTSFVLVRVWNIQTGNLAWEWNMQLSTTSNDRSHWFSTTSSLYHVQPNWSASTVEVTAYNIKTGQIETSTRPISTGSSQKRNCDFLQSFLVCLNAGEIVATDLVSTAKKVVANSANRHKIVNVCNCSRI